MPVMPRFRKKPVVVEAVKFDGSIQSADAIEQWSERRTRATANDDFKTILVVDTNEGTMRADAGDWIIKGVKGEFYPCKPDIFAMTYEPVQE